MSLSPHKKVLSVFGLVMFNIVTVASLRTLPVAAEYGSSLIFYFGLASLLFLLPVALTAAELATAWPNTGGSYIWIREAFGTPIGLLAAWMQWICSVIWFPMTLSFIAGTLFYLVHPSLAENNHAMLALTLAIFWLCTLTNFFGMQISSAVSNFTAIVGNLLPIALIVLLAAVWLWKGNPSYIHLHVKTILPHADNFQTLAFFSAIIFGLLGLEMSAIYAEEVKNPERDYPKALFISTGLILSTLTLASLAIALIVPPGQISIVTGLVQAFDLFLNRFHLQALMPLLASLIIIGGLGSVAAWILGPTKALMVALKDSDAPSWLFYTNRHEAPVALLLLQGVVFTALSGAFLLMPTVSSSYWIITAMATQTALLVYIPMFAALIKLRQRRSPNATTFKIPGGNIGLWLTAIVGILTVSAAAFLCFIPPSQINVGTGKHFVGLLLLGDGLFCVLPILVYRWLIRGRGNPIQALEEFWENSKGVKE